MKIALLLLVAATFVGLLSARPENFPKSLLAGSSLEYEIINPDQLKPRPSVVSPQPNNNNNKSFVYDPKDGSWTPVKSTDPEPKEGTLVWNQKNDKWLTQTFLP